MSRQARQKSATGYYHVIVRGAGKQLLFEESGDYRYFLFLLEKTCSATNVSVCAYCLMDNHAHLLLHDRADDLPLFMKKLGVSYSGYFNKKYERVGHLFQDRYFSQAVEDDPYFLSVYKYILLNPQKAGLCSAESYPWSSYKLYGNRSSFVDTSLLEEMLGSYERYEEFLSDGASPEHVREHDGKRLDDETASEVLKNTLGIESGSVIRSYDRHARDEAIRLLSRKGLSERQIERLTGISRKIIHQILW